MTNNEKINRINDLTDLLNKASQAYYSEESESGTQEIMPNYEYDSLYDELNKLQQETGYTPENSPTNHVGTDSIDGSGKKEAHEYPMLSLPKSKNITDLIKWADGRDINLSFKEDGSTVVATYDNGRLTKLVTRGNGHIGINITYLASAIGGLPVQIPEKGHMVVRGEALITYSDFNAYNELTGAEYANPRNLLAGTLNSDSADKIIDRHPVFRPFKLVYLADGVLGVNHFNWSSRMEYLRSMGFTPVEYELLKLSRCSQDKQEEMIKTAVKEFTDKVDAGGIDDPVDGLVICYENEEYAATGSVTQHHATRAGYAFKWQDETAKTTLREIEWSCAINAITPVAIFDPVQLEGTTVKRASLCNISECRRLGIGDKGTKLSIIKANKIIPKCVKADSNGSWLSIPVHCPVCSADTEIITSESGAEVLTCTNPLCFAKQIKKLVRFVSKDGFNVVGLSKANLQDLIAGEYIKNEIDLLRLPEAITQDASIAHSLARRDGWGGRSVGNLIDAIRTARKVNAENFLYALCIPMCGHDVSRKLLETYPSLVDVIVKAEDADYTGFEDIEGIGSVKAAALKEWFANERNQILVRQLLKICDIIKYSKVDTGNKCNGLTFVITGDVHTYKNRNELKAYIESEGGKVTGSVSKNTDYLINNDIGSTSGKNKKAKELGVEIISEDTFNKKFH